MKYFPQNAFHEVTDPETGDITWRRDPSSHAIEYSDMELQAWIDQNLIPQELEEFARIQMKTLKDGLEDRKKFLEKNPNPTMEDELEWMNSRKGTIQKDVEKSIALIQFLLNNHEKLKQALETSANMKSFALPSHSLMFSLLAMFAGKPERIPRELLEKPHSERTQEEQATADQYLSQIFESKKEVDYSGGIETINEKKLALICNNPKVEGRADISWSLFRNDLSFREERLAIYIKRTFGPEGIRHLLGLIIGLEENYRQGHFEWSVNEHLERLGYRKKSYGSFDIGLRKMASEIIKIFTGLCITSTRKDGKNDSIKGKFLFMMEGFEVQAFEKEVIDEKITLVATDFWYKSAFSTKDGQAPQYTKLLKEIVKENHREHPLTLYLAPLLAIFWRINPERKFKVKTLMEWCDLETEGKYKSEHLKDLESALDYMKRKQYLGEWTVDGKQINLSKCEDAYDSVLSLTPPEWLKNEFVLIQERKEILSRPAKQKLFSKEEFIAIFDQSELTGKQFANSIGVTPQMISSIVTGKRRITKNMSEKINSFLKNQETKVNRI